jgi:hypothetical protein
MAEGSVMLTTQHPLTTKVDTTFAGCGGRSASIVHLQTKSHGVCLFNSYSNLLKATGITFMKNKAKALAIHG